MRYPKLRFKADSSHNEQRPISSTCTRVTSRSRQSTLGPERAAALIGPCSCRGYAVMELVGSQHLHACPPTSSHVLAGGSMRMRGRASTGQTAWNVAASMLRADRPTLPLV